MNLLSNALSSRTLLKLIVPFPRKIRSLLSMENAVESSYDISDIRSIKSFSKSSEKSVELKIFAPLINSALLRSAVGFIPPAFSIIVFMVVLFFVI